MVSLSFGHFDIYKKLKNWLIFLRVKKNSPKKLLLATSTILMCSSGGGGGPEQFFCSFFQHVKKTSLNFWVFVNIKVAPAKLDHLGFYCKYGVFDRTIRKFRNWNQSWVLIGGTPSTNPYIETMKSQCNLF